MLIHAVFKSSDRKCSVISSSSTRVLKRVLSSDETPPPPTKRVCTVNIDDHALIFEVVYIFFQTEAN